MIRKALVVGIIILLIGMNATGSYSRDIEEETVSPVGFIGNTLYVGGSGPGNYSKIQDAIDNASDGDTVFVYGGTYYENLVVDKSINLIGEDRNTTHVYGDSNGNVIKISADYVNIRGFYITGDDGIYLSSNHNYISMNIFHIIDYSIESEASKSNNNSISNNEFYGQKLNHICAIQLINSNGNHVNKNKIYAYLENGFFIVGDDNVISENMFLYTPYMNPYYLDYGDIVITGDYNEISNNTLQTVITDSFIDAITIKGDGSHNIIYGNIIIGAESSEYGNGIKITDHSNNNVISYNNITGCTNGIDIMSYSSENEIFYNSIKKCFVGIGLFNHSLNNVISDNNFFNNRKNAIFWDSSLNNKWDGNYWDAPRVFPYPIFGYITLRPLWYLFWGLLFDLFPPPTQIKIDWNPAQEPYDI